MNELTSGGGILDFVKLYLRLYTDYTVDEIRVSVVFVKPTLLRNRSFSYSVTFISKSFDPEPFVRCVP